VNSRVSGLVSWQAASALTPAGLLGIHESIGVVVLAVTSWRAR